MLMLALPLVVGNIFVFFTCERMYCWNCWDRNWMDAIVRLLAVIFADDNVDGDEDDEMEMV